MAKELRRSAKNHTREVLPEDPPPVLGTWRRLYLAVIGWLFLLIIVFYLFARRFTP